MKFKDMRFYHLSAKETKNSDVKENKIELVSCPNNGRKCTELLSEINNCFVKSDSYIINKEFNLSIDLLRNAFYKTTELKDSSCKKCVTLFRSVISQSVEKIYFDLEKMPKGMFGTKRFQTNSVEARKVLDEFESFEQKNKKQAIDSSDYFIGNINRCVV